MDAFAWSGQVPAPAALYCAKVGGRNQVVAADEPV
jgi:putative hemolysin